MKHNYLFMTAIISGLFPISMGAAERADSVSKDVPERGLRFEKTSPEVASILKKSRPVEACPHYL